MFQRQIKVFLFVGLMTVGIDFLTYKTLISLMSIQIDWAKGFGFVLGTCFSYLANRFWTFSDTVHPKHSAVRFISLYCLTLVINVSVNAGVLSFLHQLIFIENIAFLTATVISATVNFLGMKWLVFNSKIMKDKK